MVVARHNSAGSVGSNGSSLEPSSKSGNREAGKKVRLEQQQIRGLTLLFVNKKEEHAWNQLNSVRFRNLSIRYLFACSIFQGIFFWSDALESRNDERLKESLFMRSMIRLVIAVIPTIFCFFISMHLVVPTQMNMFIQNIIYGVPTLFLYYESRKWYSHFDSLYLIYGLAFFVLPKISPLKFMYASCGALFMSFIFMYASAFHLDFEEWMLSNVLVTAIFTLMVYISYSSEKAARERYLLKDRLKREKISLRMVATSIQDDFTRTAKEERINSNLRRYEITQAMESGLAVAKNGFSAIRGGVSNAGSSSYFSTTQTSSKAQGNANDNTVDKKDLKKNLVLFFKGLFGWAMVVMMSYSFDMVSHSGKSQISEVETSTAFVMLMHTSGFSVFLLYFTGQIRWLLFLWAFGLSVIFLFNESGLRRDKVIFGTHTIGYMLLFFVVVILVFIFGGIVLVWSNLVEFLKEILGKYPKVKSELSENKLLQQVLVSVISQLPEPEVGNENNGYALEVTTGGGDEESTVSRRSDWNSSSNKNNALTENEILEFENDMRKKTITSHGSGSVSSRKNKAKPKSGVTGTAQILPASSSPESLIMMGQYQNHDVINMSSSSDECNCSFCNKTSQYLLPVCSSWQHTHSHGSSGNSDNNLALLAGSREEAQAPACTAYAALIADREHALQSKQTAVEECLLLLERNDRLEEGKTVAEDTIRQLRFAVKDVEATITILKRQQLKMVEHLKKQHTAEIESSIDAIKQKCNDEKNAVQVQYKLQIAELKRLIKVLQTKHKKDMVKPSVSGISVGAGVGGNNDSGTSGSVIGGGSISGSRNRSSSGSNLKDIQPKTNQTRIDGSVVDKNGVDITLRTARRNANNPNNPHFKREKGDNKALVVNRSNCASTEADTSVGSVHSSVFVPQTKFSGSANPTEIGEIGGPNTAIWEPTVRCHSTSPSLLSQPLWVTESNLTSQEKLPANSTSVSSGEKETDIHLSPSLSLTDTAESMNADFEEIQQLLAIALGNEYMK